MHCWVQMGGLLGALLGENRRAFPERASVTLARRAEAPGAPPESRCGQNWGQDVLHSSFMKPGACPGGERNARRTERTDGELPSLRR